MIPMEFQHASEEFQAFLKDARDASGLTTRNQTYTMVQAVLQTFRRRLEVSEAIRFAGVLPPLLWALFVTDWDPDEPKRAIAGPADLAREVQSLRQNHNFSPNTAIQVIASAVRRRVDSAAFDETLRRLPPEAADFWKTPYLSPN
jgi:uncharacterized protein (DUF2267 family)